MSELLRTFFEETNFRAKDYTFLVQGVELYAFFGKNNCNGRPPFGRPPKKAIKSLMEIVKNNKGKLQIDVVKVGTKFERRERCLYHMNRLSSTLNLQRAGVSEFKELTKELTACVHT